MFLMTINQHENTFEFIQNQNEECNKTDFCPKLKSLEFDFHYSCLRASSRV